VVVFVFTAVVTVVGCVLGFGVDVGSFDGTLARQSQREGGCQRRSSSNRGGGRSHGRRADRQHKRQRRRYRRLYRCVRRRDIVIAVAVVALVATLRYHQRQVFGVGVFALGRSERQVARRRRQRVHGVGIVYLLWLWVVVVGGHVRTRHVGHRAVHGYLGEVRRVGVGSGPVVTGLES
jgi:hypothetical protein